MRKNIENRQPSSPGRAEYTEHYRCERNHQGLGNALINGAAVANNDDEVVCRERLGGMLRYYHREAA